MVKELLLKIWSAKHQDQEITIFLLNLISIKLKISLQLTIDNNCINKQVEEDRLLSLKEENLIQVQEKKCQKINEIYDFNLLR